MVDLEKLEHTAKRAATGDSAALNQLLGDCRPLVFGRCLKFLPNELDAEEATQDVLLAVSRRIGDFEGRSKFSTWLYQITTNSSIDCYRKLKRRRSVLDTAPELAAAGSTPSVVVGARVDLLEAANQLDRRVVEPVLLRDLFQLDYAEIARLLDVPPGTVKSRIHEGRAKLRHALYGSDGP